MVEVCDNGPGIAENQRQSVLRRFDRGDASPKIPGSGLGLSVVVPVVHLHQITLALDDGAPGLTVPVLDPGDSKLPIQG